MTTGYIDLPVDGIESINGSTVPAQIIAAGSGISVSSVAGTTTITNTGGVGTTGNLTDAGTDGIVVTGGTGAVLGTGTSLAQHVPDSTHNGYLSSTDWSIFNSKQATVTVGALDAQAANANGLALASNVLSSQSADATHPGMVNTTTQTFAGAKTFANILTTTLSAIFGTRITSGVSALVDGSTPALDASLGNTFTLSTTTTPTIAVPTNPISGQCITIAFKASGGARTLALNTGAGGFRFGSDITALSITVSGKTDYVGCKYNAADSFWDVIAYTKGY